MSCHVIWRFARMDLAWVYPGVKVQGESFSCYYVTKPLLSRYEAVTKPLRSRY